MKHVTPKESKKTSRMAHMNIEALVLRDARATLREQRVGVGKLVSTGTATTAAHQNHPY